MVEGGMESHERPWETSEELYDAVVAQAEYLDPTVIELNERLLRIAHDSLVSQESMPEGWDRATTQEGQPYFWNRSGGKTQWQHPLDAGFREKFIATRLECALGGLELAAPAPAGAEPREDDQHRHHHKHKKHKHRHKHHHHKHHQTHETSGDSLPVLSAASKTHDDRFRPNSEIKEKIADYERRLLDMDESMRRERDKTKAELQAAKAVSKRYGQKLEDLNPCLQLLKQQIDDLVPRSQRIRDEDLKLISKIRNLNKTLDSTFDIVRGAQGLPAPDKQLAPLTLSSTNTTSGPISLASQGGLLAKPSLASVPLRRQDMEEIPLSLSIGLKGERSPKRAPRSPAKKGSSMPPPAGLSASHPLVVLSPL